MSRKGVLLVSVLVFIIPLASAVDWWDTAWEQKRQLTVAEQSGQNLSFYPVVVERVNIGDTFPSSVRVVDESNRQVVNETGIRVNTDGTVNITFRVNLSAEETATNLAIYYRNPDASWANKSWNDVRYNVYDDFSYSNPLNHDWQEYTGGRLDGCRSLKATNRILMIDPGDFNTCGIYRDVSEVGPTALAELRGFVSENNGGGGAALILRIQATQDKREFYNFNWRLNDPWNQLQSRVNGTIQKDNASKYSSTDFGVMMLGYNGSRQFAGIDQDRFLTTTAPKSAGRQLHIYSTSAVSKVDWIKYRNYVEPEPLVTVGPEQSLEDVHGSKLSREDVLLLYPEDQTAFVASLGVDAVPVEPDMKVHPLLRRERTVLEVDSNVTEYDSVTQERLVQRLNGTFREQDCPVDREKKLYAAMRAALNESAVVCLAEETETPENLTSVKAAYLERVRDVGDEVNHIVVSSPGMVSAAAVIAADQRAFLIMVNDSGDVDEAIVDAVAFLGERGMYLEGPQQYVEGLYISLMGVPSLVRQDPVEKGKWGMDDPRDGKEFHTDMPYGDLDGDGKLDAAVGRYPEDLTLAATMYLRSKYYPDNKKALVASEYLHANWPVILAYVGGGMWAGKSMEGILEGRGYEVSRSVEHRADPAGFLVSLTPANLQGVLDDSRSTGEKLGSVLGDSVGSAASQVLVYVKALQFVEQGLENYLEFDWSTFGFDAERSLHRLPELEISDPKHVQNVTRNAVIRAEQEEGVRDRVVAVLKGADMQEAIAEVVYAFLWPDRYDRITAADLQQKLPEHSIIYYEGVGNGSAWFMPNAFSYKTPLKQVKTDRYTGENNLPASEIPFVQARIVFDNSDLAARFDTSRPQIWNAFLEQGSASFIGTSTVNYAPYSSEIDTRFFKHGYTVGESLKDAVNDFSEDFITWDPFNMVARNGVKQKMLRSFILYGNPEMAKDPVIEDDIYTLETQCDAMDCTLTVTMDLNYTVEEHNGSNHVVVESNGQLLESFNPVIPLIKAAHTLPTGTTIHDHHITRETRMLHDVTVPVVEPLSHGGTELNQTEMNESTKWYPANASRFELEQLRDDRTQLMFVQAAYQYNQSAKTAVLYEYVTLQLNYTAPFALDISADDGLIGEPRELKTVLTNHADRDTWGKLLLKIGNATSYVTDTVERNFTKQAETAVRVPFTPKFAGEYLVEAFFVGDHQVLGPRTATFTVTDPATLVKQLRINEVLPDPVDGEEFVELYNPGEYDVDLDRMRLRDAAGNTFTMEGGVPGNRFRVFTSTTVLNNGGDTVALDYCPEPDILHTVTYPDGLGEGEAYTFQEEEHLFIAEVIPDAIGSDSNESLVLHNPTMELVNLSQYRIVEEDRADELNGVLAPNASTRVYPSSVSLNNDEDTITLARWKPCEPVDEWTYDSSTKNRSIGRYPDGADRIVSMTPTPGAPNEAVITSQEDVESLVLNELLPAPEDGEEFIELFNPTVKKIGLTGIVLRDAAGNEVSLSGTVGPREYYVVEQPPALNNDGDTIQLLLEGDPITEHSYSRSRKGVAIGRSPDVEGPFGELAPTPGGQNPYIVHHVARRSSSGSGGKSITVSKDPAPKDAGPFITVDVPEQVYEGVPFTVEAVINNTRFDRIYSYAYNGSTPVSTNLDGQGHWTANAQHIERGVQHVELVSVIEENETGTFDFTVRAAGDDTTDQKRTITVADRPTLTVAQTLTNGSVDLNVSTDCLDCTIKFRTPTERREEPARDARFVSFDRSPGTYEAVLTYGDHVVDREQVAVDTVIARNGSIVEDEQEERFRDDARTPTGAVSRDGSFVSGLWEMVRSMLTWVFPG